MRELAEGSVVSVRGSDEWQGFGLFVTRVSCETSISEVQFTEDAPE